MVESSQWEPSRRARRRALQALYQWQLTGHSAHQIKTQFFETQDFSNVDEELFTRLLGGVIRDHEALAADLQPLLDRPMKDVDVMERIILLMGAWQLRNAPELPFQVVLSESVELAQHFGSAQSHAYVNAVLDRAARSWASTGGGLFKQPG
jgi:N utilization substance protein B